MFEKKNTFFLNSKPVNLKYYIANNSLELMMGLRFQKKKNMLLIFPFKSKWKLDMLFCKDNLYLIFLDNNKVVDIVLAKKSGLNIFNWFRVYSGKKKYNKVLEINSKDFEKLKLKGINIKTGDKVQF